MVVIERSPSVQDIFGQKPATSVPAIARRPKKGWVVAAESAEMQEVLQRYWHTVCLILTYVSGAP
jgi:hypothetical protein